MRVPVSFCVVTDLDVFLSRYHLNLSSPKRLSDSSELSDREGSENGDFIDVHEIHIEDEEHDMWWLDSN